MGRLRSLGSRLTRPDQGTPAAGGCGISMHKICIHCKSVVLTQAGEPPRDLKRRRLPRQGGGQDMCGRQVSTRGPWGAHQGWQLGAPPAVSAGPTYVRILAETEDGKPCVPWVENSMRVDDNVLRCAVYMYGSVDDAINGDRRGGTGFSVRVPLVPESPVWILYAVTAEHVVKAGARTVRYNRHDGRTFAKEISLDEWSWPEDGTDIAVAPLVLPWNVIHGNALIPQYHESGDV